MTRSTTITAAGLVALALLGAGIGRAHALEAKPPAALDSLEASKDAIDEAAELLLKRMQARYQSPQSLQLSFKETYVNHATGRKLSESGLLVARRPGEMRWEYHESEKVFVMSRGEAWFYVPDELVVYRMSTQGEGARRLPIMFLAGEGDLSEVFAPSIERDEQASTGSDASATRLRLRARDGEDELDHLTMHIDQETAAVRKLSVVDVLGNVTEYTFSDERLNPKLESRLFRFIPPPNVDIVEQE